MSGIKNYCARSIFLVSLLLVLSSGGFSRCSMTDSCRSYSEALATTFYSHGRKRSSATKTPHGKTTLSTGTSMSSTSGTGTSGANNLVTPNFVRGGSSSIFSSAKEDTEDDLGNLEKVLVSNHGHNHNNNSNNNSSNNVHGNVNGNHSKNGHASSDSPSRAGPATATTAAAVATTTTSSSSNLKVATASNKIPTNISIQKNGFGKMNNNNGAADVNLGTDPPVTKRRKMGRKLLDFVMMDEEQPIPTKHVAETNLPTDIGHFRLRAYRVEETMQELLQNEHFGTEPCVIYATDKPPFGKQAVPVRIHDQCFTSEVFRSQRCDCKEQLKMSLEYVLKHGGAIIYLQQEGRGIGLANKIAAYALQDVGMDTVDANVHLGFPEDCRQYGVVPSILQDMGIESVRLITNNPRKIERLAALGVNVVDTIPMVVKKPNPHNRKYLQTKKDRMNHKNFGDMLSLEDVRPASDIVENAVEDILKKELKKNRGKDRLNSVADEYINEGEEMAAAAISSALMDVDSDTAEQDGVDSDNEQGVVAKGDGYCFGKASVEEAIAAVGRGEIVVVVDDMDRENEGDFIMAADLCTPETMATIVRFSSGVICIGMEGRRMDELNLPSMVENSQDPKGTAFSITVDAASKHGITTGISARDRAKTMNLLANPSSTAMDFVRPGHIFPLRAKENGVLSRDGHTEAAVDLARLAGRHPSGVLCEIVSEENPTEMARLPELKRFCKKHGFVLTSIVDLAQYRRDTEMQS